MAQRSNSHHLQAGLTMIELLVVATVIGLLMIALYFSIQIQITRSQDSRRKADLEAIKVAFEDYYNDNNCYPPANVLLQCNGSQLEPYMDRVPCDPDDQPYLYQPLVNRCDGYKLFAQLQDPNDPVISQLGCAGSDGCHIGAGFQEYNYGISAGTVLVDPALRTTDGSSGPSASASPTPAPSGGVYVCVPVCNVATQDYADNCDVTFATPNCNDACGESANWCEYAISGGSGGAGG